MPVPVINTALKVDPSLPVRVNGVDSGEAGDSSLAVDDEGKESPTASVMLAGDRGAERKGCIALRHYYLGAGRAKCLESALISVQVALREVNVVARRL